jgi:hypothetical protein
MGIVLMYKRAQRREYFMVYRTPDLAWCCSTYWEHALCGEYVTLVFKRIPRKIFIPCSYQW